MLKWAFIENIVWAVGLCSTTAVAFYSTQSFHSLWILVIGAFFLNAIKTTK